MSISNLIILGNGFDLAHNLKTSYTDFIQYSLEKEEQRTKAGKLFIKDYFNEKTILENPMGVRYKNSFFRGIIMDMSKKNWCDIEELYFQKLSKCLEQEDNSAVKKLNDEFEVIKQELEKYLTEKTKEKQKNNSYQAFFDRFRNNNIAKNLILNFNYTNTPELYKDKSMIVNIHGELNNNNNPMIFGYAAKEMDLKRLYDTNDNRFLFNIKQKRYGDSKSETQLNDFLEKLNKKISGGQRMNIYVLGHSCGISDSYILNRIFNHNAVNEIRIFYYDQIPNQHYEIRTNMERIMDNRNQEQKIKNIRECSRMPQHNDREEEQKEFINYIDSIKY